MNPAEMAEPIEVQFMMWTRGIHETIIRWELRFPYVKVHFWQGHTVEHAQICLWSIYSDLAACSLPAITAVTHTHTHTVNGPFSGTARVSQYLKGKTNLDFTESRDSE